MPESDLALLWDMRLAARDAQSFVAGLDEAGFGARGFDGGKRIVGRTCLLQATLAEALISQAATRTEAAA